MMLPKCLTFIDHTFWLGSMHDHWYTTYSFDKRPTGPIRVEITDKDSDLNKEESYPLDNGIILAYCDWSYDNIEAEIYYYDDNKKENYHLVYADKNGYIIIQPDDIPSYELIKLVVHIEYNN